MKKLSKKLEFMIAITVLSAIALSSNFVFSAENNDTEEPVISSMVKYKDMDYEFLKTFHFGGINEKDAVLTFNTVEELKNSTDIRLKNNKYIVTKGYYAEGDLGGASYRISDKVGDAGSIPLSNGLYANIIPDTYQDSNQVNWIVLSIKQFGAKGDGVTSDQDAINATFSFANSYTNKDRAIIYLPKGEYKACNQIQANVSNINLVGEGDNSVIFTDNDYRKDSSYDEPFFASWNGKNNFFGYFKLDAREVDLKKYMRQMCLYYCENMYIYHVNYYIPEEAWSGLYYEDKQYTNLTIYTGDKQITVDDCVMYQMSGTYRGANIGIMDFWKAGTEDITIMNCELHDNARDEQIGIFSVTGEPTSYVKNVDFVNNAIYTYSTPYREVHGWRTMCFTIAYGDNNVQDINIANNNFISEADSKFMTFGSVRDCKIHNNKFQIKSSCGNMGYIFDSSCSKDEDVIIDSNEFDISYKNTPNEGKCLSAGYLTFSNNKVVVDATMNKISDRLGTYKNNEFTFLTPLGSCGSATKFNNSKVTAYAGHSNVYSEIMFMLNEGNETTDYEYMGNTVTDYEYYNGAKNQKVYDRLSSINGITANSINFSNNIYHCPNYRYTSSNDYIYLSWYRSGSNVKNLVCENNDLQGAKGVLGYEIDNAKNTTREFTEARDNTFVSSINIVKDGKQVTEITTADKTVDLSTIVKIAKEQDEEGNVISETEVNNKEIDWLTNYESMASVENGKVTRKEYGDVTVYATSKDGSGIYSKVVIHFVESIATDIQIEQDNITMKKGSKHQVMYKVIPNNADQNLEWKSENNNIATVSETGIIEGISLGETYITCRTTDGSNIEKKIKVNVVDINVTQIILSDSYDYYENPGVTKQLSVSKYLPENASNIGISKWESTNESVATVNQNGLVTIIGRGSCQIKAYSLDCSRYATYNIYVKPEKIQNVTVETTKNGAVINWDNLENSDGYNLYRAEGDSGEWTKVAGAIKKTNTTYYETNLKADTKYKYYVSAIVMGYDTGTRVEYEGIPSEIVQAKTNATEMITSISTQIQNLSITQGYIGSVTAICMPGNAEITELNWEIADTNMIELVSTTKTEAKFKGKDIGYTTLTISAKDGGGAKTTIPVGVTPNYKVQTVALENNYNDVTVNWKKIEEESQIDGYIISRALTVEYTPIKYIPLEELEVIEDDKGEKYYTYTDYDLLFGKTYRYAITPYIEKDGFLYACLRSSDNYITIPEYVAVDTIDTESQHVINRKEEKEVQAISKTENSSSNDFVWYSKNENIATIEKVNSNTAKLVGKNAGITKIEIIANDEDCNYTTAKVVVLPDQVSNVTSKEIAQTELTLAWNQVQGAVGYYVYRYDSEKSEFVLIGNTENYLYKDTNLIENSEYIYVVSAYLEDGQTTYQGEKSAEIRVKTLEKDNIEEKPDDIKDNTENKDHNQNTEKVPNDNLNNNVAPKDERR